MEATGLLALLKQQDARRFPEDVELKVGRIKALSGSSIPQDLKVACCNAGAVELFEGRYRLLQIDELTNVGDLQAGEFGGLRCPAHWIAFLDARDGNYIAIDLTTENILDCDHDTIGTAGVIAKNFTDFLSRLIREGPEPYWLNPNFRSIKEIVHPASQELNRYMYRKFWESLGNEVGPEVCSTAGCSRKRIRVSVKCRLHHYEMLRGHSCPFQE